MADAFIVRRGGGKSAAVDGEYAVIGVEYPAGSTCTCAKSGGATLRAKKSVGAVAFNIPESGNWTASCTDGTKTRSKTVPISYEGQVEKVKLAYILELLTGDGLAHGYSLAGHATMDGTTLKETKVVDPAFSDTYGVGGFYIAQAIDVTTYDTLTIKGFIYDYAGGGGTSRIGLIADPTEALSKANASTNPFASDGNGGKAAATFAGWNTSETLTIDVSHMTGEFYLATQRSYSMIKVTEITFT